MELTALSNGSHAAARRGSSFRPRQGRRGDGAVAVATERHGGVLSMVVAGPLDAVAAATFAEALEDAIAGTDRAVILDFGAVDLIGSAGLRVVLAAAKRLRERNARLVLCALSGPVREVLRITCFERFLTIHASMAEARAALGV